MEPTAIIETLPEATEAITQVIEVVETIDYTPLLTQILTAQQDANSLLGYLSTLSLFAVVVLVFYLCYKILRIFF